MNRIQALIDRYYHEAYDRVWSSSMTVDQKLVATEKALEKAWARIERETGYRLAGSN